MKIISYNINGLRAASKLNIIQWLQEQDADIICLQEIRAEQGVCEKILKELNYYKVFNSAIRKGYSGTAILSKIKPSKVEFDFFDDNDIEGRTIIAYYNNFIIVNCYVPNGSNRLNYKLEYMQKLINKAEELSNNNVIICGDFNIAYKEIDVNKPKAVRKKSGFLLEERILIKKLIDMNFIDTFREKNPKKIQYTWRSYKSRQMNEEYGWRFRFDYIFINKKIYKHIERCYSLDLPFSDHLPVIMEVKYGAKNDL